MKSTKRKKKKSLGFTFRCEVSQSPSLESKLAGILSKPSGKLVEGRTPNLMAHNSAAMLLVCHSFNEKPIWQQPLESLRRPPAPTGPGLPLARIQCSHYFKQNTMQPKQNYSFHILILDQVDLILLLLSEYIINHRPSTENRTCHLAPQFFFLTR